MLICRLLSALATITTLLHLVVTFCSVIIMVLFALGRSPSVFLKKTFSYMNAVFFCNIILGSHPHTTGRYQKDVSPTVVSELLSNCGGEREVSGPIFPGALWVQAWRIFDPLLTTLEEEEVCETLWPPATHGTCVISMCFVSEGDVEEIIIGINYHVVWYEQRIVPGCAWFAASFSLSHVSHGTPSTNVDKCQFSLEIYTCLIHMCPIFFLCVYVTATHLVRW